MFKLYDNNSLLYKDKKAFEQEVLPFADIIAVITKKKNSIEISLFLKDSEKPFYLKSYTETDFSENTLMNLIITNESREWSGQPEYNPFVELREQDDFIRKLSQLIEYTDNCSMVPRIMFYRHGNVVACRPLLPTLCNPGITFSEFEGSFAKVMNLINPNVSIENNYAKEDICKNAPVLDSLAYLEAQVDVLSKMVFLLAKANKDYKYILENSIPEFQKYKEAVESNSILNIKNMERCIDEININKKKVRELQKEYYLKCGKNQ